MKSQVLLRIVHLSLKIVNLSLKKLKILLIIS